MKKDHKHVSIDIPSVRNEPTPLPVHKMKDADLPATTIAFVYVDEEKRSMRALIVDAATWQMHSIVAGEKRELQRLTSQISSKAGSALCHVGFDLASEIQTQSEIVVGGTPYPPGWPGGKGTWPPPMILDAVRAITMLAHLRPRRR